MSATASTTSEHGHGHDLPPGKVPLILLPLALFWRFIQWIWMSVVHFYDRVLPALSKNPESKQYSPYFAVFTCLMIGTVLTVVVAWLDREYGIFNGKTITWLDLTVGLAIATVKASLVLAFFMHLNHEAKLIYRILILSVVFVFFMFFLCILALLDKPPHQDSFNKENRDPFSWKMPVEEGEGHGGHEGAAGEHGAEAAHGPDAAHPSTDAEHAQKLAH